MSASDPPPIHRATLREVAQAANVHPSTASRALNGTGRVHPKTVLRVRAAAAELGFLPNLSARTLRKGSGGQRLVAVACDPDSMTGITRNAQAFWFFLLQGLSSELAERHINAIQVSLDSLASLRVSVDALVVLSIGQPPLRVPVRFLAIPMAVNEIFAPDLAAATVFSHDSAAMTDAACDHLVERGARRVALLPLSDRDFMIVAAIAAYRRWCSIHAMRPTVLTPTQPAQQVREAVREATETGIDGIYAISGEVQSVFEGIEAAGLCCPDDIMVVGVGQGIMEPVFRPTLTSIFLDGEGSGREIAALMSRLLDGGAPERIHLPWQLIPRGSTDRAKRGGD